MIAAWLAPAPSSAQNPPLPPPDTTVVTRPARVDTFTAAPHDSSSLPPESGVVEVPAAREAREPRTVRPTPRFDQPRWVMLRSLLIPGWGQVHNHAWIKAALLAAGDGSLRWRLIHDERRLNDLNRQATGLGVTLATADAQLAAAQAELAAAEASGDSARIAAAQAALVQANLTRSSASDAYNSVAGVYNSLLNASINRRWLAGGVIIYALLDAYVDAHFRSFDVDFRVDPALPGGTKPSGARLQIGWRF